MIEVSLTDYWEHRNLIYQIFRKMFIFRDKMGKFNFPFVALWLVLSNHDFKKIYDFTTIFKSFGISTDK